MTYVGKGHFSFSLIKVENRFFNFHDNLDQKDNEYKKYLDSLWSYLVDFIRRSQPLFELDNFIKELDQQFENMWQTFSGWDKPRGTLDDIDDEIPSTDNKKTKDESQQDTIFCDACIHPTLDSTNIIP